MRLALALLTASLGASCPQPNAAEGEGEGEGEGEPGTPSVLINELRCGEDVVELFNPGVGVVELLDLSLSDASQAGAVRDLLTGSLAPGAFRDVSTSFGLDCDGASVDLLDVDESILDAITTPVMASDQSFGRLPDGTGAPVLNTPTPAAPNRPWADPSKTVFAPFADPLVVRLTVSPVAQVALEAAPYEYVPATFQATVFEGGAAVEDDAIEVAIRIKGKIGSFRGCPFSCGDKSAFKIDFNRQVPDQRWRRIEKLNLNNQVQDASRTHEWLAYEIFREAGVPAPRTGYAQLLVNGEDHGLFALIEDRDDPFLENHYPQGTRALFEGEYGQDLFPGSAGELDLDEGSEADRAALESLIDEVNLAPALGFYDALAERLDWDEVLTAMAVEVFIGHWDGYAPTRNNYFLHVDALDRWTLLPWGADQTFDYPWPLYDGAGLLLQRCRADPTCLDAWTSALGAVVTATLSRDFPTELPALAARLQPHSDADPRFDATDLSAHADNALAFLAMRVEEVQAELQCQADSAGDVDGDGMTCALDCDEGNAQRYVGGDDRCPGGAADGVDNDCNERVDDGEACPDCIDRDLAGGSYSFCRAPRPYSDAAANCAARGGTLVVLDSQTEWDQVHLASTEVIGMVDLWIGLDDLADEGTFTWADGAALTFDAWAPSEPNDYGEGEDCAEARPDGRWNDLFCDAALPSICER